MTLVQRLDDLERQQQETVTTVGENRAILERHEETINGKRGIQEALDANTEAIRGLYRAAWAIVVVVIIASVGFGFTILRLLAETG